MHKVAIVILNWNTKPFLEKFLPLVLRTSNVEGAKVYVADNGSVDGSVEFLEAAFNDKIGLIKLPENFGFAEGYNRALQNIQAEYFILLNSDVETSDGWLPPLIEVMESDHLIAACMPKIMSYEQEGLFEYAGAAGGFIDKYGYPFCQGRIFNSIESDYGQYDKLTEIFWASGACMIVRGPLFKIAGGLDPFFFAHMEEIDLCWRLKNRGYKIMYQPASIIYHVGGGTLPQGNPRKVFLNYRNNLLVLYKNLPREIMGTVIFTRLILDGISAMRLLLTGSFRDFLAIIKAHVAFYRNFNKYRVFRKSESRFITGNVHKEVYPHSIVIAYFFQKKYTFKSLKWFIGK